MRFLGVYYALKPFIPRRLQIKARGFLARRKLKKVGHIWPIDERAGTPPEGWPGWPDGKRFAFVITHDVDTELGQENCRALAQLEMDLGFRSCFNFVAEDYPVDLELHRFLREQGFEIGVHGLNHRGNLFSSASRFLREAPRINHYLRTWGAVGFRAPSMYGDFSLIGMLDVLYDSSSFDTDPFEPQPDGVGTIFPFIVPRKASDGNGFVELPYTLPQDHTIFLILGHKDNSVWKRKLQWIAKKGGMALLNTHPDYMRFDEHRVTELTYDVGLYRDFLNFVRCEFGEDFWHVLPKELARYMASFLPNVSSDPH